MNPRTLWEGRLPIAIAFAIAILAAGAVLLFKLHPALLVGTLPLAFTLWFFRDPTRRPPSSGDALLSPADGIVRAVDCSPPDDLPACEQWPDGAAARISIFLSIFDVHVNRSPVGGRILSTEHRPGGYLDARDEKSSRLNEAMTWRIQPASGDPPVTVRQIAGKIARRIVAWKRPGESIEAGERFGMIRFGSRTDLFLPEGFIPLVNVGERVRAGLSVVAARVGRLAEPSFQRLPSVRPRH